MANRPAPALALDEDSRVALTTWTRSRTLPQRQVLRAQIVLRAGEGVANRTIAAELRLLGPDRTALAPALPRDRSGRPRAGRPGTRSPSGPRRPGDRQDHQRHPGSTPKGETHWSSREVADRVGVSRMTVLRAWQDHDLQPHRTRSFKFSTDPELEQKVTDVIGLYLHPPEKAVVLCVDEKSQIQALDRTQPLLPMRPGQVSDAPTTTSATAPPPSSLPSTSPLAR